MIRKFVIGFSWANTTSSGMGSTIVTTSTDDLPTEADIARVQRRVIHKNGPDSTASILSVSEISAK